MVEADVVAGRDALALQEQPAARELNQLSAQFIAQRPQFLVGDKCWISHAFPEFTMVEGGGPVGAEVLAEELCLVFSSLDDFLAPELPDGAFHPAEQMDAIGDVADGNVLFR